MSKISRIRNFLQGLFTVILAVVMMLFDEDSYVLVVTLISLTLILDGLRRLWFFFRQARHMVGGTAILYRGAIILDLGILVFSFTTIPLQYVVYYLIGITLFTALVDFLRFREAKKISSPIWKVQLLQAILWLVLAVLCFVYRNDPAGAVDIYCIGMIIHGCMRIGNAFKKSAVIYIQ